MGMWIVEDCDKNSTDITYHGMVVLLVGHLTCNS